LRIHPERQTQLFLEKDQERPGMEERLANGSIGETVHFGFFDFRESLEVFHRGLKCV
jgi:hypothetical protein